jgi:fatty-acyl-CoA synthase
MCPSRNVDQTNEFPTILSREDILLQHPSVSEAAVIGVEHERWGERPLASILCRGASAKDANYA